VVNKISLPRDALGGLAITIGKPTLFQSTNLKDGMTRVSNVTEAKTVSGMTRPSIMGRLIGLRTSHKIVHCRGDVCKTYFLK
jgi:hypothetical protein